MLDKHNKRRMSKEKSLISDNYKSINQGLHNNTNYGANNHSVNERMLKVIAALANQKLCKSVLDYGCGKGLLVRDLKRKLGQAIQINGYDPGVPEYDAPYFQADVVTCFDVLEHIEQQSIDSVLNDISSQTAGLFICIIDLLPAQKKLPDGRNAHLLIAPPGWWLDKLTHTFKLGHYFIYESGNLNKKICYLGTNKTKLANLAGQVFSKAFF